MVNFFSLYLLSIFSLAKIQQLILEISATYKLVSYLLADNWLICTLCAQCMISESNVTPSVPLILSLSISKQCIIKQLLDSVFVISWIIKVSVSVLSKSAFGSADNTYFDLDHSGYHETSSNRCLFTVFPNARSRLYLSDHKTQTCVPFDPKCWYNVRKRDKDNLPYVFSGVLCVFVTFSVKNIWWVIFIHFSFIITTFGMKKCKILFLWGISTDHLNQAESLRYEMQWMYGITCRAWHRDASNSSDGAPVGHEVF